MLISGMTGVGKSEFVFRFIRNIDHMMFPKPDVIVWCYGEWQPGYEKLKEYGVFFS